ncbi:alcohol dehydrogenase B [Mycolicibacterium smegmatis MKD8]|uniref:Alcohol dehydrogenase B n=1 Tax=Mycolicibacterium smegmatis (strain MKD8) TaxID=1214915 RepID=A0A2U9PR01_MYCSE|nr:zinc-binding dehydrogenase [Mycolicibacterium smegmatis]AWT54196.1 alcohol dehydrogenase B [Mycolicibacterium smegmatis MKD8]
MITSKAAVLFAPGADLDIVEVAVAPPRAGEVLVEIVASGLCHTDTTTFTGDNPSCVYPAILGHEGAGIVREVGTGVTGLAVNDRVIPLYGPQCGDCRMCASGRTNLCWRIKGTRDRGVMPDGTSRFSLMDGRPVHHFMGTSTFSNFTVVPEIALAKIRDDAPLETVCLLGCGVTTGVGAALNDVRPGDTVVVFGLGGIGINVVQGARLAGAVQIIGVDPVDGKKDLAMRLGMTDFINPTECDSVVEALRDLTGGGVDVSFECTGIVPVMRQAVDCLHAGWGTCVLLGVEPAGAELSFPPVLARYGRTIKGSYFGGVSGRFGLTWFVDLYLDGDLVIDPLITHRLPLQDINEGFELMARGESVRTVVSF